MRIQSVNQEIREKKAYNAIQATWGIMKALRCYFSLQGAYSLIGKLKLTLIKN